MRSSVILLLIHLIICEVYTSPASESSIQHDATPPKKLHIDIYYESLCPGSMEFMTDQVGATYESFKNYIKNGTNTIFECQHGPRECFGNRLQSCVLDALNDDQDEKVQFVVCQMHKNADASGHNSLYPVTTQSLDVSYQNVMKCTTGSSGVDLQLNAEKETDIIGKEIASKAGRFSVPAIVFDKVYNKSDEDAAREDLAKIICEKLKQSAFSSTIAHDKICENHQLITNNID